MGQGICYIIVTAEQRSSSAAKEEFCANVNFMIRLGWEPWGGISEEVTFQYVREEGKYYMSYSYAQAMIRRDTLRHVNVMGSGHSYDAAQRELAKEVNPLLEDGWQLQGGASFAIYGGIYYLNQSLVIEKEYL